jgi:hypothetical protein
MGGDQDIEPPLFTTAARQITLIGIDPFLPRESQDR